MSRPDEPEESQQQATSAAVDGQGAAKSAADDADSRPSGKQQVSTPAPSNCYGQWSTPKGCNVTAGQCEYHAVWTYSSKTDYMRFTITTTHTTTWTGIGFSDDHKMVYFNAHIVLLLLHAAMPFQFFIMIFSLFFFYQRSFGFKKYRSAKIRVTIRIHSLRNTAFSMRKCCSSFFWKFQKKFHSLLNFRKFDYKKIKTK